MSVDPLALDPRFVAVHQLATFVVEPRTVGRALSDSPLFAVETAAPVVRGEWHTLPDGEELTFPLGRVTVHPDGLLLEAFSEERIAALRRHIDAFGAQRATPDETRALPLDEAFREPARLLHPLEDAEGAEPSARDLARWFLRAGWPDLPNEHLDGRTPRRLLETGRGVARLESLLAELPDLLKAEWPAFPRFDPEELREILLPDAGAARIPPVRTPSSGARRT